MKTLVLFFAVYIYLNSIWLLGLSLWRYHDPWIHVHHSPINPSLIYRAGGNMCVPLLMLRGAPPEESCQSRKPLGNLNWSSIWSKLDIVWGKHLINTYSELHEWEHGVNWGQYRHSASYQGVISRWFLLSNSKRRAIPVTSSEQFLWRAISAFRSNLSMREWECGFRERVRCFWIRCAVHRACLMADAKNEARWKLEETGCRDLREGETSKREGEK